MLNKAATDDLYRMIPDPLEVVYYSVQRDNSQTGRTVYPSERRPMSTEEMLLIGGGTKITATFHVWDALLGGIVPKVGDYLTCESESWTVDRTKRELNGSRWRLLCSKRKE